MESPGSRLLLDEPPLVVLPSLACLVGVNAAIFLQQVHYWCQNFRRLNDRRHYHRGRWWVWNAVESARGDRCWCEQFPFWSAATIRRLIARLVEREILLIDRFNLKRYDRTNWYSVDYEALNCALEEMERQAEKVRQGSQPSCQLDMMDLIKLTESIMSDCHDGSDQSDQMDHVKVIKPIPETSSETCREDDRAGSLPPTEEIWTSCLQELALSMSKATYERWVRPAALAGLEQQGTAWRAVVECRDSYSCEWLRERLDLVIRRVMAGILGVGLDALSVQYKKGAEN